MSDELITGFHYLLDCMEELKRDLDWMNKAVSGMYVDMSTMMKAIKNLTVQCEKEGGEANGQGEVQSGDGQ